MQEQIVYPYNEAIATEKAALQDLLFGKNLSIPLNQLKKMPLVELRKAGFTPLQVRKVKAFFRLGEIAVEEQVLKKTVIKSPEDAVEFIQPKIGRKEQEHFVVAALDTKNQVIAYQTIFIGTLNASVVHAREIFSFAIQHAAANIFLFHNHPSNNPLPSDEDCEVTVRLYEAGLLLGINIVDHIIVGPKASYSMREYGDF